MMMRPTELDYSSAPLWRWIKSYNWCPLSDQEGSRIPYAEKKWPRHELEAGREPDTIGSSEQNMQRYKNMNKRLNRSRMHLI